MTKKQTNEVYNSGEACGTKPRGCPPSSRGGRKEAEGHVAFSSFSTFLNNNAFSISRTLSLGVLDALSSLSDLTVSPLRVSEPSNTLLGRRSISESDSRRKHSGELVYFSAAKNSMEILRVDNWSNGRLLPSQLNLQHAQSPHTDRQCLRCNWRWH